MRTFEAVVRHGTVTDAASELDLAPSSVSEQIRTLERSLGVALFDRTARGMRLNPAGERMLRWARQLLEMAEQARREVTGQSPVVRLGALETITATQVPTVLARLATRRPQLRVEVESATGRDQLLAAVSSGELDAALLLDLGDALGELGFPAPPLAFLDLDPVPLTLVAAPGHRLSGRRGLRPEDVAAERLLVNVPNCSFRLAADRIFGPGPERVAVGGVAVMVAWAQRGLGIALLPRFAVSAALAAGTLTRLDFPAPDLALRLVWRADREHLPGPRDLLYAASQ